MYEHEEQKNYIKLWGIVCTAVSLVSLSASLVCPSSIYGPQFTPTTPVKAAGKPTDTRKSEESVSKRLG